MLPHGNGLQFDIRSAFIEIDLGLSDIDRAKLQGDGKYWVGKLDQLMGYNLKAEPEDQGHFAALAGQLSDGQMEELSQLVDDLQAWFAGH